MSKSFIRRLLPSRRERISSSLSRPLRGSADPALPEGEALAACRAAALRAADALLRANLLALPDLPP